MSEFLNCVQVQFRKEQHPPLHGLSVRSALEMVTSEKTIVKEIIWRGAVLPKRGTCAQSAVREEVLPASSEGRGGGDPE